MKTQPGSAYRLHWMWWRKRRRRQGAARRSVRPSGNPPGNDADRPGPCRIVDGWVGRRSPPRWTAQWQVQGSRSKLVVVRSSMALVHRDAARQGGLAGATERKDHASAVAGPRSTGGRSCASGFGYRRRSRIAGSSTAARAITRVVGRGIDEELIRLEKWDHDGGRSEDRNVRRLQQGPDGSRGGYGQRAKTVDG